MPNLFKSPLAIVDVETTGMSYKNGGVIDIGILRIESGQVVQTMRQLINPSAPLPAFITNLTGIKNEDVEDAPTFGDVATDVYEILEDCIFIAHNVRFDYAFIKEEFHRAGYQYRPKQLCTVRLSKSLYPQYRSHKLDALIERFNIPIQDRHRAFADAQATWQALQTMVEQQDEHHFDACVSQQLRQPSLPTSISTDLVNQLPSTPGVYIFEGSNGAPLYVGKSVNIRQRVMSHFSDDHRSTKELRIAQEITNIRTIQTNGEMGALLKESQLIKELMPIHNRMLRRQTDMVMAVKGENEDGYPTINIERHTGILAGTEDTEFGMRNAVSRHCEKRSDAAILLQQYSDLDGHADARHDGDKTTNYKLQTANSRTPLDAVMGVYRSERQAKESLIALAKEFKLCHKLLGLQKTTGACFPHQLKNCPGACVGKESNLEYLMRFNQAFASTRIKQWPYLSAIIIQETNSTDASTSFIIDQWCLVGVLEHNDQDVEYIPTEAKFDLDQYKIFKRYIENPKNRNTIKPYSPSIIPAHLSASG